jgi:phage gpG-like protein
MLYKDGDLQDKFIYHSTRTEAVVGTNANNKGYDYPAVHQFGTKDKKTPARTFMPFDIKGKLYDDVEKELEEIVVDFLENAID